MVMRSKESQMIIRLLESDRKEYFLDCVDELYRTIQQQSGGRAVRTVVPAGRLKSWLVRKLQNYPLLLKQKIQLTRRPVIHFAAMISGDFWLMIPAGFRSRRNYIYMYDVWPRFQRWIFPMLDFFNIDYVFFSARQVYEDYLRQCPDNSCRAMWLPEALNAEEYHFKPTDRRSIDVLEFGRSYDRYHELIAGPLSRAGKNHIYRKPGMPVLFPGKPAFTAALADSRIVICVPSDISHPQRAEYISTMTLRYLQAMASKCLVVGIMPSDMEEIFGYVPIIEIDMEDAGTQILEILEQYERYLPLIEQNYQQVLAKHQWTNRWEVIRQKMEEYR